MAILQKRHTEDALTEMESVMETENARMTVKVRLERGSDDTEIRRFQVAADANYNNMKSKITEMFPNCPAQFYVSWTGKQCTKDFFRSIIVEQASEMSAQS